MSPPPSTLFHSFDAARDDAAQSQQKPVREDIYIHTHPKTKREAEGASRVGFVRMETTSLYIEEVYVVKAQKRKENKKGEGRKKHKTLIG